MNKNIFIGFAIVIVILTGFVFYSLPKTEKESATTKNTQANTSPTTSASASTSPAPARVSVVKSPNTFKSIFNQPGNHTCSYEKVTQTSKTSGVIYIADGKMRGEFRTTDNVKTIASMMVYNGGTLYVWTEGMGVGSKAPMTSISQLPVAIPEDLTSGSVLGSGLNSVSWDCHDWSKNNTLLAPPTTVKFY